jgi:hypothetical protein
LATFPFSAHETGETHEAHYHLLFLEAHYHLLFLAAGLLAGEKVAPEISVADGKFDAYYQAPDGAHFVIEIKRRLLDAEERRNFGEGELKKMGKRPSREAMRQIESRNYAKPYVGLGQAVYRLQSRPRSRRAFRGPGRF